KYVFFKGLDDNKSYKTCLSSEFGNYPRWQGVIAQFNRGQEVVLDNLIIKSKNLIDADSPVIQLKNVRSQMLGNGQESFASKGALIFIDALKEKYMTLRKKEY
ncbi:MAG: hypothetical protein AABY22_03660, partial [Nanoarchaeota archaeon]